MRLEVRRDLGLSLRIGGGASFALVFFLMIVTLTPFAIGPDLNLLARIAPAILWIGAVLATLIGLAHRPSGWISETNRSRLRLMLSLLTNDRISARPFGARK